MSLADNVNMVFGLGLGLASIYLAWVIARDKETKFSWFYDTDPEYPQYVVPPSGDNPGILAYDYFKYQAMGMTYL